MKRMRAWTADHPVGTLWGSLALVAAHAVVTVFGWMPNVWSGLIRTEYAESLALYLGGAGAAALIAGFVGVVVVFGLSGQGTALRVFRTRSGATLRASWMSLMGSGFAAAGLAICAGIAPVMQGTWLAPWLFEASLVLMAQTALRMLWLMSHLVTVITADDAQALDEANLKPLPRARRRG
ncbi:hypothetical protein [Sinomonas sp.]|uniref:hypothetical protein n=1 Tax=Sinomonas sp. TaxID=1914986 RepID=UPI003F7E8039